MFILKVFGKAGGKIKVSQCGSAWRFSTTEDSVQKASNKLMKHKDNKLYFHKKFGS